MKTACLTVVYPGVENFIEEYIDCISAQTFRAFDMVVLNDRSPLPAEQLFRRTNIPVRLLNCSGTPQQNRLTGLKLCLALGYDIVICSDSDETMFSDRIEKVVAFFSEHPEKNVVYNNSVCSLGERGFELFYKERITLNDLLDFNVLGYGALNLRKELIPFVLEHANERIVAFDWWLAMVYLLRHKEADFLKDAKNNYRMHPDNFAGPVFDVQKKRLELGIKVKKCHYSQLAQYCRKNGFEEKVNIFEQKLAEVTEIETFITENSLDCYFELVKNYFENKDKIYWWQDVVPLKQLKISNYETMHYSK